MSVQFKVDLSIENVVDVSLFFSKIFESLAFLQIPCFLQNL